MATAALQSFKCVPPNTHTHSHPSHRYLPNRTESKHPLLCALAEAVPSPAEAALVERGASQAAVQPAGQSVTGCSSLEERYQTMNHSLPPPTHTHTHVALLATACILMSDYCFS